ncbi:glycosyltransferase [Microbacterium kribbense]|uniref:glycosyltransferase n=1 Tax=Microbacterium kribbense TaxID=433645 RepID=UPI0031DAE8FC
MALHTTLYDLPGTFPEFGSVDVQPMPINRWPMLRKHHRLALPWLAGAVSNSPIVHADVMLASSSGWAHGIRTTGRKVVYCHAPARWLYQTDRYAGPVEGTAMRSRAVTGAVRMLGPRLRDWDQHAAESADRYLVNSTVVQRAVAEVYGIQAEVLPPPPANLFAEGEAEPVVGVSEPFVLCVARLLPYKNVAQVIEAVGQIPGLNLVVVGDGPERARLEEQAARVGHTLLAGRVADAQLRWLYENCTGLVAASYEDFGLTPLEAAAFGKPTAALRDGGYLDTVIEGVSGMFFDEPTVGGIADAVSLLVARRWDAPAIGAHAELFSEERFIRRLHAVVEEELARV